MKLKEGFLLRNVAGQAVVLPMGGTLELNMMITLNETGAFIWERLSNGQPQEEIVKALCEEYEVEETDYDIVGGEQDIGAVANAQTLLDSRSVERTTGALSCQHTANLCALMYAIAKEQISAHNCQAYRDNSACNQLNL